MSSRFHFGQIVSAWASDGKGHTKERPVVIIDGDETCRSGDPLLVVFITKSIQRPLPYYHILLHDSHAKDPVTGLYYPCVAECNMPRELDQAKMRDHWGPLPDDLLTAIIEVYEKLCEDPDFDDWQ